MAIFDEEQTALIHSVGLSARVLFGLEKRTSLHGAWMRPFGEDSAGHAFVGGAAHTY